MNYGAGGSRVRPMLFVAFVGVAVIAAAGLLWMIEGRADTRGIRFGQAPFAEGAPMADVAENAVRGVVNISTTRVVSGRLGRGRAPLNDPFFEYFFGPGGQRAIPGDRRAQALGSGVIVSPDGIILTNNHVVDGADGITVMLFDGREMEAELVGADPKSDLAVLRLTKKVGGLQAIPIGDSDKLRLAETVIAIGNPFGLGNTVTSGIVSAKGRANMGIVDYEDFIQTDAAINPGNSGGALLNARGQLVGINTAIVSETGGYQGIGFAIPSNMALGILNSILENGRVVRGWMGVVLQDLNPDLAAGLGMREAEGVLISDVPEGTPADKAGLRRGDVILKVGGEKIDSSTRLRNVIASRGAGARVQMTVLRDSSEIQVTVELGEQPSQYYAGGSGKDSKGALEGLEVGDLTPETRQDYRIPGGVKSGVVVTDVERGSAAARGGLRPGDVVLEVNRKKVDSVSDFRTAYEQSKSRVLLLIVRHGHTVFLTIQR